MSAVTDAMVEAAAIKLRPAFSENMSRNIARELIEAALSSLPERVEAVAEVVNRIAPADVWKLLKQAHDGGYLDYDHLPKLSRDIAAMVTGPCQIPDNVYYSREHDDFYSLDAHKGQGHDFYRQWSHRRSEFPSDPRLSVSASASPVTDQGEVERLRKALEEIANPVSAMKRRADEQGYSLDGQMAQSLARDPYYLQGIARAALEGRTDA